MSRVISLLDRTAARGACAGDAGHGRLLRDAGERMWPAWRALETWEGRVLDDFEGFLGELLLLLWLSHRFAGEHRCILPFDELVAALTSDPLLSDVAEVAFALGAGWSGSAATWTAGR